MTPLKEAYNSVFFDTFLIHFKKVNPNVDDVEFKALIFTTDWEQLELKQRMRHITKVLHSFLNHDFNTAVQTLKNVVIELQNHHINGGFEYLFIPDYIEIYGQDYLETSITSFETITPFVSCEFAIRPFIIKHPDYVLAKMKNWSFHDNLHLRRLSSEGCRPRLPWAMALPKFKIDPSPILPILTNLLNDKELYVRKSVANNLNDITKDNKEIVIQLTEKFYGETEETNWILKHANRNLLKQAEPKIMKVFGFGNHEQINIQNFKIDKNEVAINEYLNFSFNLVNNSSNTNLIRLEYAVYYLKQNGSLSKKIFQISQKEYPAKSTHLIKKQQHFKLISTRKYHFGIHTISIIANGKEFDLINFTLKE